MPVEISSTFQITVDETIKAGGRITLVSLGRSFRVVSVVATAAMGAIVSCYRQKNNKDVMFALGTNTSGQDATGISLGINDITEGCFGKKDQIVLCSDVAKTTQIILYCTGFPAQQIKCV